jgi:IMP dehydrogenase/GMP reductase
MENIFLCNLNYKPLADFLNLWGKNKNKFLPAQYIIDNKKYLKGLYDGLIDSDGHIEKKHIDKQGIPSKNSRINFTNSSVQIIELFNVICFILNGAFPNNEKRKITTGNLVGANIENFNQCYNSRVNVATKIRVGKNYQISKLLEYSDVNIEVPVYDLTVDCPTHSFIANNSIVHNSICLTRIEAGAGVPQLTALDEIYEQSDNGKKFKIISDGGLRKSGDCVKALCLSHVVMLGGMLAGTDEAPGETIVVDGKEFKTYSGSSTYKTSHVEGVTGLVANKGPVSKVIDNILQGIRSGCSYQGARNLEQLRKNYQFVSISNAGLIESKAHDVIVIK